MLSIEINIEIIANREENMDTTVYLIRHSEKLDTKYMDKYKILSEKYINLTYINYYVSP